MMADRNATEQAYAFFHQKLKVYEHSTSEREMDHIENVVSAYADAMSTELYKALAGDNVAFLHEHSSFRANAAGRPDPTHYQQRGRGCGNHKLSADPAGHYAAEGLPLPVRDPG